MLTSIKDLSDTYMHLDNKYGLKKYWKIQNEDNHILLWWKQGDDIELLGWLDFPTKNVNLNLDVEKNTMEYVNYFLLYCQHSKEFKDYWNKLLAEN